MPIDVIEPPQAERLADDLLFGAKAIGDELGVEEHQIYYLYKTRRLPIGKLGKHLIASRRKLARAAAALIAT